MTDVQCHKCGYEWTYSGELQQTTCPSCGLKTSTEQDTTPDSDAAEV